MAANTSRPARLGETLLLRSGVRVRLRLVHFSDLGAIAELIDGHGPSGGPSAERLVQFDPRRRYVVCAMALIDGSERLVGLGAIELALGAAEPEVLIFDPYVGEELSVVLRDVLCAAAEAAVRTRAA
jgi:hypothetical protein